MKISDQNNNICIQFEMFYLDFTESYCKKELVLDRMLEINDRIINHRDYEEIRNELLSQIKLLERQLKRKKNFSVRDPLHPTVTEQYWLSVFNAKASCEKSLVKLDEEEKLWPGNDIIYEIYRIEQSKYEKLNELYEFYKSQIESLLEAHPEVRDWAIENTRVDYLIKLNVGGFTKQKEMK